MSHKIGWGLLVTGAVLTVAEHMAQADATLNNVQFSETKLGQIVAPINAKLPMSLGLLLLVSGAAVLWLMPLIVKE